MPVEILGIRHHGPGSARSVRCALEALQPDIVLIEGPPDANDLIPMAGREDMRPPVAILSYAVDEPRLAVFDPFAVFSPEWQAIQHALARQIPARFMDLPMTHYLAIGREEAAARQAQAPAVEASEGDNPTSLAPVPAPTNDAPATQEPTLRQDPIGHLARAAGYSDGERWWESVVEQRRDSAGVFAAVLEAMSALREQAEPRAEPGEDLMEQRREAAMRQIIRAAQKEGFERIAVICGAWHAPVLANMPAAKQDSETLKGLPKVKIQSTWVPWTYGRLASASGYGAGIDSPGWYEHLWTYPDEPTTHWLTRVASLLRESDLDASSAQVIDAARMVHSLTAIRNRYAPGLTEMNDACLAVLCHGNEAPLRLIHRRLIVSERLGEVPEDTPAVPLQRDLQQLQKTLRLPASAEEKTYDLDLRNANDLARSRLLHRLNILSIPWGDAQEARGRQRGTFHEIWQVLWKPEYAVALIEASVWGNTVFDAATAFARHAATEAKELAELTKLLNAALLADLAQAIDELMRLVQDTAAVSSDVLQMMDAMEPLVRVARYGDVRGTASEMVHDVVNGLLTRICVGLPAACSSLDEEAARGVTDRLTRVQSAVGLLEDAQQAGQWYAVLDQLAHQQGLQGLVAGRTVRLLHDAAQWDADQLARSMSLALSHAQEPAYCAAWLEGFLSGSGLLLVHDVRLWELVDAWVMQLPPERFVEVLPLLRRTFSTFAAPERRQMGERAKSHSGAGPFTQRDDEVAGIDTERADRVLPLLAKILGVG